MRGWNRCDCCCRFFSPERDGIYQDEHPSMDLHGNVTVHYEQVCGRCEPLIHKHDWEIDTEGAM